MRNDLWQATGADSWRISTADLKQQLRLLHGTMPIRNEADASNAILTVMGVRLISEAILNDETITFIGNKQSPSTIYRQTANRVEWLSQLIEHLCHFDHPSSSEDMVIPAMIATQAKHSGELLKNKIFVDRTRNVDHDTARAYARNLSLKQFLTWVSGTPEKVYDPFLVLESLAEQLAIMVDR
jgi:hypothetical protein